MGIDIEEAADPLSVVCAEHPGGIWRYLSVEDLGLHQLTNSQAFKRPSLWTGARAACIVVEERLSQPSPDLFRCRDCDFEAGDVRGRNKNCGTSITI